MTKLLNSLNIINLLAVALIGSTSTILQFHPGPETGSVLLSICWDFSKVQNCYESFINGHEEQSITRCLHAVKSLAQAPWDFG